MSPLNAPRDRIEQPSSYDQLKAELDGLRAYIERERDRFREQAVQSRASDMPDREYWALAEDNCANFASHLLMVIDGEL